MENLLEQIALCIQRGKIDAVTAYPPDMKGMKGAGELTLDALNSGIDANRILSEALIPAMSIVDDLSKQKLRK
jgi:5-methyltetrahydrofolate--homocysteine methyltransferase